MMSQKNHMKDIMRLNADLKLAAMPRKEIAALNKRHGRWALIMPPSIKKAQKATHTRLLKILQFCPLSDWFLKPDNEIIQRNRKRTQAFRNVIKLICKAKEPQIF